MRLSKYKAIAHNIAHSFSSGASLMTGVYGLDVAEEIRRNCGHPLTVDFLWGRTHNGTVSENFSKAVDIFADELTRLFEERELDVSALVDFRAEYRLHNYLQLSFTVIIELKDGRSSIDDYEGYSGRRKRIRDGIGRLRRSGSRSKS